MTSVLFIINSMIHKGSSLADVVGTGFASRNIVPSRIIENNTRTRVHTHTHTHFMVDHGSASNLALNNL